MRTLERISVSGFKSIRELKDLELRQLNVMIGANGAGKSNFLKLFEFLHQTVSQKLQRYALQSGGANSILHFGQKNTATCSLSLQFRENNFYSGYRVEASPATGGGLFISQEKCLEPVEISDLEISQENCWAHAINRTVNPHIVTNGRGHYSSQESFLPEEARKAGTAEHILNFLLNSRPYHFTDTTASAYVKQIGDIGDNRILRPDASNLAAILYLFRNHFPANYDLIVRTVRMVAPFFDDFALQPLQENQNKIRLDWRDKGSDVSFDASYLSDGTLRFICMATLLLQPRLPALVIVDEPELGLHPSAINLLAELLASVATKTQVLVSTQSVSLVNEFQPEDIIVVDREEGNSTFNRLDADELSDWLSEYSLGELWEKNIFGGRP